MNSNPNEHPKAELTQYPEVTVEGAPPSDAEDDFEGEELGERQADACTLGEECTGCQ